LYYLIFKEELKGNSKSSPSLILFNIISLLALLTEQSTLLF